MLFETTWLLSQGKREICKWGKGLARPLYSQKTVSSPLGPASCLYPSMLRIEFLPAKWGKEKWACIPKTFLLSAKLQPTSRPDCVSPRRILWWTMHSHGRPRNLSRKCAIGRRCRLGDSWLVEIVLPWAISRPLWGLDICSPWLHQESHVLIAISAHLSPLLDDVPGTASLEAHDQFEIPRWKS